MPESKLPSGRLGVGNNTKAISPCVTAAEISITARSVPPVVVAMAEAIPGSSKAEDLSLMLSTTLGSRSTPRTSKPPLARQAAKPSPSFPSPMTDSGSARIMLVQAALFARSNAPLFGRRSTYRCSGAQAPS